MTPKPIIMAKVGPRMWIISKELCDVWFTGWRVLKFKLKFFSVCEKSAFTWVKSQEISCYLQWLKYKFSLL